MDLQKFMLFVPFEINDIIKTKDQDTTYKILDITHTYSAKERNIIAVDFKLQRLDTQAIQVFPYKQNEWVIVKQNDEEDE